MFLLQHLVLRSARAHKSLRYVPELQIRMLYSQVPISTHALAREARFSFLLFGFETLKSSYLDSFCEGELREQLYSAAFSWFAVRPQ